MANYRGVSDDSPSFASLTMTGNILETTRDNLVAFAGGGQTNGTPIVAQNARFVTVATAADSGLLPASKSGLIITCTNAAGVNSMNVFPGVGDAINALAVNTAFAVAAGKTCQFVCYTAGIWHTLLSA